MASTAVASPRIWPWVAAKLPATARCTARITASASRAKASPACARRHRAGQDAHADQEHVFEPEHADAFEQVLVVARLRERGVEPPAEFRVVRQGAEEARIDQRVHHLRIARQRVGEPRRDAEHEARSGRSDRDFAAAATTAAPRRADWRGNGRTAPAWRWRCRCAPTARARPAAAPRDGCAPPRP